MNLLLDTHVLLWWLDDPAKLAAEAQQTIADGGNTIFVSAAVTWEITIKKTLGKLEAPDDLEEMMIQERFRPLPIAIAHTLALANLPSIHQDPFDRIQIAQAQLENLIFATRDTQIKRYEIPVLTA